MEILQAVSKLKTRFSSILENEYAIKNYGIKSCISNNIKSKEAIKLELIFLSNLCYVPLNDKQLQKVTSGNYNNLFIIKDYTTNIINVDLNEAVIVNNVFNSYITNNNYVTENPGGYTHTQSIPSSIWAITNPLPFYPGITLVDTNNQEIYGQVNYTGSYSIIVITFSQPIAGKAYLS